MRRFLALTLLLTWISTAAAVAQDEPLFLSDIDVGIPHVSTDKSVRYDYDIVYVRARRAGDSTHKRFFTDFSQPVTMEPGADLVLLHPDGSQEVLVEGNDGSITDPVVSFDGQWVYYSHLYNLQQHNQWNPPRQGADIFKLHLPTRRIVRLTNQRFDPNTGAAPWSRDFRTPEQGKTHFDYGVFNMGPFPLPGGRVVFTSNREGFRPAKGYPVVALQLFVMDDSDHDIAPDADPPNFEKIGHLNISGALHPVVLKDGRIMYSTLESQGIRSEILWGVWTIHPDGTNWAPLVSAFDPGGAPNGFHFQTQLGDGSVVVEQYYNQNNSGFGAYVKLPAAPPDGYPAFGPAFMNDARTPPWRYGRFYNGKPQWYRMPFMPTGSVSLTPFTHGREGPADPSRLTDKDSPKVGKFTHPSGAPDNHLLTCYSPGPVNHQYTFLPQLDGGIYLLKHGKIADQPADLRLIKNDPNYNECWPRAVVPYRRIYSIDQPATLPRLVNDGRRSRHLPEGSPFGLVGTSSFYKRESYPNGAVPAGGVTAGFVGGRDPWKGLDAFTSHGNGMPLNWHNQGGDAGLYANDEIHAVRILAMEPTTDRHRGARSGRLFYSHAMERLRVLGEIPLRKFAANPESEVPNLKPTEPLDPDGNPDTSFMAKIPADTAFTFQTLDQNGLVLNMAQTWHQLRPGEVRADCGGCHAHSQKPTEFRLTTAARDDYRVWDLVNTTPLVVNRSRDESKQRWDAENSTGLRFVRRRLVASVSTEPSPQGGGVFNVEYHRDIRPILDRSCVACHSTKDRQEPAGNLNLDADSETIDIPHRARLPGTYYRLAADEPAKFGHKPVGYDSWGYPNASRYIRMMQSRRSLLVWKIFGRRLDGFSNDEHPSESKPGAGDLVQRGQPVDLAKNRHTWDLDFTGSAMPPADAVQSGKVKPLSDEDRRTLARWIDLGCPIDLDYDASRPDRRGDGWMLDDNRPILTLAEPQDAGPLTRILIGMHDYDSGIDPQTLTVTADFAIDGVAAGENLASRLELVSQGVWRMPIKNPPPPGTRGRITVSVRDRQGNTTRVDRLFRVGNGAKPAATPADGTSARQNRWLIRFPKVSQDEYERMLDSFGIELAYLDADRKTLQYLVDVSGAGRKRVGDIRKEQRMFWFWTGNETLRHRDEAILRRHGLEAASDVVHLYSRELEQKLVDMEVNYMRKIHPKSKLEEVAVTTFRIVGSSNSWRFEVERIDLKK